MRILFSLWISLLVSCGEEPLENPKPVSEDTQKDNSFKYKTYKRITPQSNLESDLLKKHNDLNGISREILNIYDNSQGLPPSSSSSQE